MKLSKKSIVATAAIVMMLSVSILFITVIVNFDTILRGTYTLVQMLPVWSLKVSLGAGLVGIVLFLGFAILSQITEKIEEEV